MLYIAEIDENRPWQLTSDPVLLSRPLYGWENVSGTINNEGPHGFVKDHRVYLGYSGGSANSYTYAVGLLTADDDADLLCVENWKKSETPVLSFYSVEGEYGPGHHSFYTDEQGELMIAYHAEDALEQIAEMLPDPTVRQRVLQCRLDLQQGVPQGEALVNTGLFTGLQNGLIAVACQSGALDTTLRSMAEENLQEVDRMIQRAVSLIEPVMIGLTAVIIGSILLSVMLPLTGMIASLG